MREAPRRVSALQARVPAPRPAGSTIVKNGISYRSREDMLMSIRRIAALALGALLLISCGKKEGVIAPGPDFEKRLQTALIEAKPGSAIELPEGRFDMTGALSLTVANVTIRGKGIGKNVLSYKNQKSGAAENLPTGGQLTPEKHPAAASTEHSLHNHK